MSVGLILFTLADSTLQPNFDQTGKLASIVSAIVIIIECHAKFITFVNICIYVSVHVSSWTVPMICLYLLA